MAKTPKNLTASIRQRLLDLSRREGRAYIASIDREGILLGTVVEVIRSYTGPACERLTST